MIESIALVNRKLKSQFLYGRYADYLLYGLKGGAQRLNGERGSVSLAIGNPAKSAG